MQYWRRLSIVIIGFVEALIFSGCLFGWPALLHVLQQEGVYSHLCPHSNDNNLTSTTIFDHFPPSESTTYLPPHETPQSESELIRQRRSSGISNEELQHGIRKVHALDRAHQENAVDEIKHRKPCKQQTVHMTLIYTLAAVSYGLTSILVGFSLDIFGLWFTRIGGCVMTSGGFFLLAFTTQDSSWILWPALILVALGTSQLRLSSFQFANLWPKYRTTILILYSSAYSVSTTVFLIMQMAYAGKIPYQAIGLTLAVISLLTFPPTLIMPRMKIQYTEEDSKETSSKTPIRNDAIPLRRTNSEDLTPRILRNKTDDSKLVNPFDDPDAGDNKKRNQAQTEHVPLSTSLWTLSAGLHQLWHFINFFIVLFYSATLMPWLQMITDDPKIIEHYNKISGICALIAPLFIPIAGLLTDWRIREAAKQEDRVEKLILTMQAPALTMAIASLFVLGTMICKVFFTPAAIYISMILIAVSRPFIVGSCASYIQIRFHPSHFNRLNGIFTTIVSIMSLVQFPIILWMKQSSSEFVKAQILLIGVLVLAFTSPGHMMIKPLARRYATAQLKFRTDV